MGFGVGRGGGRADGGEGGLRFGVGRWGRMRMSGEGEKGEQTRERTRESRQGGEAEQRREKGESREGRAEKEERGRRESAEGRGRVKRNLPVEKYKY